MAKFLAAKGLLPDPDLKESKLFDIDCDNDQLSPIDNKELEQQFCQYLIQTMLEHQSPKEQFERLGLTM